MAEGKCMVTAESKKENYLTAVSNQSAVIYCNTSNKSSGEISYLNPHELLCAALASCLNITARMVLDHKNLAYTDVFTKVDIDRITESKTKFIYNIDILGDIPEDAKQRVKEIVKNSPVIKTLSKEIEFDIFS
jgi:putative redox protein